jgi:hypothetical protein
VREPLTPATLATWANLLVRSIGLLVLLPMVMAQSAPADVVVWLLLGNAATYAAIADFGLLPTCTRAVAFALARPSPAAAAATIAPEGGLPALVGTMRSMYRRAAFGSIVVALVVGMPALAGPIGAIDTRGSAWLAAASVLAGMAVAVMGNQYAAFLSGSGQVATVQRTLAWTGGAGILTGLLILAAKGSIFAVIVAQQAWTAVGALLLAKESERAVTGCVYSRCRTAVPQWRTWIWSGAWRSGVSTLLTAGALQASNFLVAQIPDRAASAAYLFSLRLVQAISQFAQAPFYSRIPELARLQAEGELTTRRQLAASAMRISHWVFVAGFGVIVCGASPALRAIGSAVAPASPAIMAVLGVAMFGERYGAMHLQLFSTTNKILWHVAAMRYFAGFLVGALLLMPWLGLPAVPVALLVSCWTLYVGYCTRLSYAELGVRMVAFERTVMLPALAALLLVSVMALGWEAR